jgi:hypothetical protein
MTRRADALLNNEIPGGWLPWLKDSERQQIWNAAQSAFARRETARVAALKAHYDKCPFPKHLHIWTACLSDDQWPHMRMIRVLFSSNKGNDYQTWIFRTADDAFQQEKFWTLKAHTMCKHDDRTKGKMPISWRDVTHEVIWC